MAFCYHARRANLFPISTPPAKSTPSKWMGNLIAMPMDHPTAGGDAKMGAEPIGESLLNHGHGKRGDEKWQPINPKERR
ncbi:MAG: hypothetical protein GDYSWBUE_000410 [Candidatus Fervidibacterota bacterium]